jgi:hypothetical protein
VRAPGVRELVQIPRGVVALTDKGEVRRIDSSGVNRVIGRWRTGDPQDDTQPTVRAQDDGKVVWLDGTTTPEHSFVVYDPASGRAVARRPIPTGGFHEQALLNEFEDGVVYWDSPAYGQRSWDTATAKVAAIGTGATFLLAVENGLWVTFKQVGEGIEISESGQPLWASKDGRGWFSSDGDKLVTLTPGPNPGLRVQNARTGQQVAGTLSLPNLSILNVYLGESRDLSYVGESGTAECQRARYDLVTCDPDTSGCTTVVAGAVERPLLPSD